MGYLVVAWCEYNHLVRTNNGLHADKILRETFLCRFCIYISLIEVVKDMEDIEGDRRTVAEHANSMGR